MRRSAVVPNVRLRPRSGGLAERLGYRLDRFLALHPAVQLLAVGVWATLLAVLFGALSQLFANDATTDSDGGFWWAVTRMLDGGTVAADSGFLRRFVGIGVTLVGMVLVAVVTGAFASSFADRLRQIRRGTFSIFERRHLLLLGYGGRADVVLRELAASGLRVTIVIVTAHDRELVEERVREALNGLRHRLKVIVRRADPTTTGGVLGASAPHARAVVILPEVDAGSPLEHPNAPSPTHAPADRAAMRSLLAARRALGTRRTPIVIEIASERGRDLVGLCSKGGDLTLVEEGDVNTHLLVHAVRQPGVLDVVRQILSLDARSVYIHTPGPFLGRTFDEAHAVLAPGVLIGLLRNRKNLLCPPGDTRIDADDRLLVFADDGQPPMPAARLSLLDRTPSQPHPAATPPAHVLLVGYREGLANILRSLHLHLVARVTVLVPPEREELAKAAIDASGYAPDQATLILGRPVELGVLARATAAAPTALLLLASDVAPAMASELDADQLVTLLQLRSLLTAAHARTPAVVEIHSAETERLIGPNSATDFVLSREVVGMLLAQELHAICLDETAGAWLGEVFRLLLDEISTRIWLRPIAAYVPGIAQPTFADLLVAARLRGETAIGVREPRARARLLPARDERFDPRDTEVVVIAAPELAPHTPHAHPTPRTPIGA